MPYKDPEKRRAYKLRHYYENKARYQSTNREWRMTHRAQNAQTKRRWREANRERDGASNPAWRKAHPEKIAEYNARNRARRRNAPNNDLTAAQWEEIKAAYGYRCVYCARKMKRLTRDHITPIVDGGPHTASNIVPACRSCNSRKNRGAPLVPVQPLLFLLAPPHRKKKK